MALKNLLLNPALTRTTSDHMDSVLYKMLQQASYTLHTAAYDFIQQKYSVNIGNTSGHSVKITTV